MLLTSGTTTVPTAAAQETTWARAREPAHEVIVVTGSTSVGATDQLRRLLHDAGARMVVDTVACRPGHPQLLAGFGGGRRLAGGVHVRAPGPPGACRDGVPVGR
ncbi:molybdopterin-binding protein [Streptomyces sp. NPDC048269]|uniref:molybdopterin-binding protein n=1 Tax=Streptomyces sp. NPDC048269 TaxID=3155753 RepID=UPI0034304316